MNVFSYIMGFAGIDKRLDTWYYVNDGDDKIPQGPFNGAMMDVHWKNDTVNIKHSLVYCTGIAFILPSTGQYNNPKVELSEFVPVNLLLEVDAYEKIKPRALLKR